MKFIYLFLIILVTSSCFSDKQQGKENSHKNEISKTKIRESPELQAIIDSAGLKGSILIYNSLDNIYYSNDFIWADKGKLPASTFKIANSIIALETGIIESDSSLLTWNGEKRSLSIWEKDMDFREAFHLSCVPCYQSIAREIGSHKMNEYLTKLDYGNMDVNDSNIDVFWLEGDSKISQYQQINFLKCLYNSELPISKRTVQIIKRMMIIEDNDEYRLSAKTGWSIRNGNNNGWFVGYIEVDNKVYFFATNIDPQEKFNMNMFSFIRKEITYKAFIKLGIIKPVIN